MNFAGTDSSAHAYFINLCSTEHKNATCFDAAGNSIPTFACQQVSGWGFAADLGHVIGYLPADDPATGLTVQLTQGSMGCAATHAGVTVPRSTIISMLCDINAGVGAPRPAYNNTVENPPRSCVYNFIWRSLYACPLCTIEDYEISVSQCSDGNKILTHVRLSDCWEPNPIAPQYTPCQDCPQANGLVCGGQGSCDDTSGTCHCESNWEGTTCTDCSTGVFGPQCDQGLSLYYVFFSSSPFLKLKLNNSLSWWSVPPLQRTWNLLVRPSGNWCLLLLNWLGGQRMRRV